MNCFNEFRQTHHFSTHEEVFIVFFGIFFFFFLYIYLMSPSLSCDETTQRCGIRFQIRILIIVIKLSSSGLTLKFIINMNEKS